jgi:N-acetylmuramoyl-L-alanine amidase
MLGGAGAQAASQDGSQPPGQPPVVPSVSVPLFSPSGPNLGTFTPNTITVSAPPAAAPTDATLPPGVRPRAAWGAAPPVQPYSPHTPKEVSLHHTGAPWYGKPGPEQYLRNIQAFHTGPEREWEDIAYHYLIDLDGVVWEGRPPTVKGNPSIYYDVTGVVLISYLGDFDSQVPTDTQLASASDVAAWLMKRYTIPTTALSGHRDHAPTNCPGDNLYHPLQDGTFAKRVHDSLARL